jgi:mono/diheme cytochrome c family protein
MKTKSLIKILAVALAFAAVSCWQAAAVDGKELWNKNCAACHGMDGKGETRMGRQKGVKDYTDSKVQATLTDEQALKAIKEGVTEDGKEKMKSFADKVNDEEAKALVAYLRTFKK